MKTLVSLSCSSESIEKSLTLFYNTLKSNEEFYNKYKTIIYYGNDLPKKNLSSDLVGSIKFYIELSKKIKDIPVIDDNYLLKNKKIILEKLVENEYISYKCYKKYYNDNSKYINFIHKITLNYKKN